MAQWNRWCLGSARRQVPSPGQHSGLGIRWCHSCSLGELHMPPEGCCRPKGGDNGTAHCCGHSEPGLPAPSTGQAGAGEARAAEPCPTPLPRRPPPAADPGASKRRCEPGGWPGDGRGAAAGARSWARGARSPLRGGAMEWAGRGVEGSGFEPANFSSGQGRAPGRRRGRVSAAGWGGSRRPGRPELGRRPDHLPPRGGSRWGEWGGLPQAPWPQPGQRAPGRAGLGRSGGGRAHVAERPQEGLLDARRGCVQGSSEPSPCSHSPAVPGRGL